MNRVELFIYLDTLEPYELSNLYHALGLDYAETNMKKDRAMNRNFFDAGGKDIDVFEKFVKDGICTKGKSVVCGGTMYHVEENKKGWIYTYWRKMKMYGSWKK